MAETTAPTQPLAGIRNGVLFVQAPLTIPNGMLIALGLLQSAIQMVHGYFAEQEMIKVDALAQKAQKEKNKIDLIIK